LQELKRNDYLANTQSKILFGIGEIKYEFRELWKVASEKINFFIDFNIDDYKIISTMPSMPVLDLKLYAMKMFIGAKKGLYEIDLKPENDKYTINPSKPKKRFDAKVIGLSAKSGQVMISGGSNGLFHGTFLNKEYKLKVVENPLAKKSLRTSWSAFDTINYEQNNEFDYFVNQTEKLAPDKKPTYSKFDERPEPKKITKFGKKKLNLSELLEKSTIEKSSTDNPASKAMPDHLQKQINPKGEARINAEINRSIPANAQVNILTILTKTEPTLPLTEEELDEKMKKVE